MLCSNRFTWGRTMVILYITLNTDEEARRVSRALLEKRLAVCTNWFPITCAYRWKGDIVEESETVLIVKTLPELYDAVTEEVKQHISYTNFIAQIEVPRINNEFANWLEEELCGEGSNSSGN
ncbi:MAG: divalent-cation tolerance protein CutA [Armatimonadota bacterium]|nr:divalent-cation tolerance protein CutA [Armatimonadota bacterium]